MWEQARSRLQEAAGLRGVQVWIGPEAGVCLECAGPMVVEKTIRRRIATLAHGCIQAHETVRVCAKGCRCPDGSLRRQRSPYLAQYVPRGGVFGYDVIVHVGFERFLRHRSREEIRRGLEQEHGLALSTGEISALGRRFLDYLAALHRAQAPALAQALRSDGGWPLHVDATGEGGRGTMLVLLAGWRRWVLGAYKIPTERADAILPHLHEVAERFGDPRSVMRDLGRAMIGAVSRFVAKRKLACPVLACHLHFLADVGKDLLAQGYDALRKHLRRAAVRPRLRALARELGRSLGSDIARARQAFEHWQKETVDGHRLPEDHLGAVAVVRGLTQWVLDYPADSVYGNSLPFDRPWLDLYERCRHGRRALDAFCRHPHRDRSVQRAVRLLRKALDAALASESCAAVVSSLRMRAALFDELRDVLRAGALHDRHQRGAPSPPPLAQQTVEELAAMQSDLERLVASLRERRPARGPAEDKRAAIDLILAHLARHGDSLFGHGIALPAEAGGGVRLVERTNNLEENFFRRMKQRERRRSGRKVLTQDLEHLPPEAALVPNLEREDYVEVLCGSLENLPRAFAQLDARALELKHSTKPKDRPAAEPPCMVESASLPAADRRLLRSEGLKERIDAAARSRAPRTARTAG